MTQLPDSFPDRELRARLARLDPAGDQPVDPVGSSRAAERMERAMQTLEPLPTTPPRRSATRRLAMAGGAALAAAAAVTAGVLVWGGDDPAPMAGAPAGEPTTLELSLPRSDVAASCLAFDEQFLAAMPVAFAGTVVTGSDDEVVLDVDRWFTGGDADRVRLDSPGGGAAVALGYGVEFAEGERYLVTAANGTVNGCGFTVPATPDMEAAFERAFTG
jgi:hypothetical protein